ncbi:hypothetical protein, partial [Enterobacter asburiae]
VQPDALTFTKPTGVGTNKKNGTCPLAFGFTTTGRQTLWFSNTRPRRAGQNKVRLRYFFLLKI